MWCTSLLIYNSSHAWTPVNLLGSSWASYESRVFEIKNKNPLYLHRKRLLASSIGRQGSIQVAQLHGGYPAATAGIGRCIYIGTSPMQSEKPIQGPCTPLANCMVEYKPKSIISRGILVRSAYFGCGYSIYEGGVVMYFNLVPTLQRRVWLGARCLAQWKSISTGYCSIKNHAIVSETDSYFQLLSTPSRLLLQWAIDWPNYLPSDVYTLRQKMYITDSSLAL